MKNNPFVGPRPYERGDHANFFGRTRDARDLTALIQAERVVLFYAQSGAGKTSLLNAQVIPALEEKGFNVLPVARVGSDVPPGIDPKSVKNIFVFSALMSLVGQDVAAHQLTQPTLLVFLRQLLGTTDGQLPKDVDGDETLALGGNRHPPILILDQFEEILTTHRDRWQDAQGFFEQLEESLRMMPELGVVLAMREDHVAGLDPYAPLLPRRLRTRFRIEQLGPDEALEAVTKPALNAGCPFDAGVAERLVDDLRQIKVQSPEGAGEMVVLGPYVEPVQLQVVCNRLWEALPEQADHAIQWEEIEQYGNIDRALTDFYESALTQTCQVSKDLTGLALSERRLRHWFSEQLITPMRTRGLALQGKDETAGLPNVAVDVLEKRHLIRADARAGARWYELVHDRLVDPILKSNQAWEIARQTPLRMTAKHWQETKSEALLYRDKALKEALAWAKAHPDEAEPYEQEFLQDSQRLDQVRARTRQITIAVTIGLAIGLVIMVVLAIAAFRGQQVAQQAQATAVAEADIRATAQAQAEVRRLEAEAAQATAVAETKVRATAEAQAVEQRQIAVARQLAAQASRYATEKQTDLALLLSLEANRIAGATWAQGSLLEAVESNRDLITFLRDHTDEVRSVAFSPDGKVLASAGKDTTIILWDVATRQPMGQPLKGHTLDVSSVAFSPDGKLLASASDDNTIIFFMGRGDPPADR